MMWSHFAMVTMEHYITAHSSVSIWHAQCSNYKWSPCLHRSTGIMYICAMLTLRRRKFTLSPPPPVIILTNMTIGTEIDFYNFYHILKNILIDNEWHMHQFLLVFIILPHTYRLEWLSIFRRTCISSSKPVGLRLAIWYYLAIGSCRHWRESKKLIRE